MANENETRPPDRGLGDTIKRATTAIGIKPCAPCRQRAERLNRLFPYRQPAQPQPAAAEPDQPGDPAAESPKQPTASNPS